MTQSDCADFQIKLSHPVVRILMCCVSMYRFGNSLGKDTDFAGAAEQEALDLIAGFGAEQIELQFCLHPFGGYSQAQFAA